ncbi:MAG: hypothetical protein Q9165_004179 [Trypethelium subeluteriae]
MHLSDSLAGLARYDATKESLIAADARLQDANVAATHLDLWIAIHTAPYQNPRLLLPRLNDKELRSFRFFLEKTAPAFAGVFHIDFWLQEIPRACHVNAAIWHAAVSLGAVDESYNIRQGILPAYITHDERVQFALQQFGASIKHLIDPSYHLTEKQDKRVALAASVLFTCICSIQGLQNQALIHLRGGLKLLQEIKVEEQQSASPCSRSSSDASPLSLVAMQSVLNNLNIQAESILGGRLDAESPSLVDVDHYSCWRLYQAPSFSAEASPSSLGNIVEACRAVESLFNSMVVFFQRPDIYRATLALDFETVSKQQLPFMRVLQSLTSALSMFEACSHGVLDESTRKAITVLKMFHIVCRFILIPKKVEADRAVRFDSVLKHVVDLATQVLDGSSANWPATRQQDTFSSISVPVPSMSLLLLVAAISARTTHTRERAIELMKAYPRREGLWDSFMAAELARTVLHAKGLPTTVKEEEAMIDGQSKTKGLWTDYMISVAFHGERKAEITMKTFHQWMNGEIGKQTTMEW